jgi:AAA domain/DnaB-like helicase N terminal domain
MSLPVRSTAATIPSLTDFAIDSEKVILGSLFLKPSLMPTLTVTGLDFSNNHHKIFDSMLSLWIATEDLDPLLVAGELRRRGQYWSGAATYIGSLTDGLPKHMALDSHCERIRSCAVRRKLARLCEETLDGCLNVTAEPGELLARHFAAVAEIDANRTKGANSSLGLISADEVKPETTEWLIEQLVPKKCVSLLVGDPGDGKTWVSLSLSACLTRGTIPFGGGSGRPHNVLYLSNEDGAGELRARFDRLGGDPKRMWFESAEHAINLGDAGAIEAAVQKYEAALVVVDTVTSHFGAKVDFHKASEVAAVLGPLTAMGQRTGVAILGLMHLSKSMQGKSLYRVQGSTAFAGAARSVLGVGRDPSDPTKRILVHMKSNGSAQGSSREFVIDNRGVTWGEVSGLGAADVLGPETGTEERGVLSNAIDFLREALSNGSRDASEIRSEAKSQDIKEITLKRAKAALRVQSRKKSVREGWIWWLPEEDHEGDHQVDQKAPTVQTMIPLGNDDPLGKYKGLTEDILPGKHEGDQVDMYRAPSERQMGSECR